jgi:hypothetical protein
MKENDRLLIVEFMLGTKKDKKEIEKFKHGADLLMTLMFDAGSGERTPRQFELLLKQENLQMKQLYKTRSAVDIIEAQIPILM